MKCKNCGKEIPEAAMFCTGCGTPVSQPAADAENTPTQEQKTTPAVSDVSASGTAKAAKKGNGAFGSVMSVIFGILIFACVLCAVVSAALSSAVNEHKLSQRISETDISEMVIGDFILDNDDIVEFLEDQLFDIDMLDEESTVSELVADFVPIRQMTSEDVPDMLKKIKFYDYLGQIVKSYEDYLINGDSENPLSSREIKKFIEKAEPGLQRSVGYTLTDFDRSNIDAILNDYKRDIAAFSPDNVFEKDKNLLSVAVSPVVPIVSIIAAAVLTVLLALITKSAGKPLLASGIAALLAGITAAVASFLIPSFISKPLRMFHRTIVSEVTEIIRDTIITPCFINACIAAAIGIILIIIAVIIRAVRKN